MWWQWEGRRGAGRRSGGGERDGGERICANGDEQEIDGVGAADTQHVP